MAANAVGCVQAWPCAVVPASPTNSGATASFKTAQPNGCTVRILFIMDEYTPGRLLLKAEHTAPKARTRQVLC
jgi:hypothetical protein